MLAIMYNGIEWTYASVMVDWQKDYVSLTCVTCPLWCAHTETLHTTGEDCVDLHSNLGVVELFVDEVKTG